MQFECTKVSDFVVVSVKDKEGNVKDSELRFLITTPENVADALYRYMDDLGDLVSVLAVAYEKQAELPLAEADDKQGKLEA